MNESSLYPRPRMNKREAVMFDNRTMDEVTVMNLPPNAVVKIQVRVLTKYYVGPASDPVTVTTPQGGMFVILGDVVCLMICTVNSNTVNSL